MRPNVDKVDLYSIRELSPAAPLTPDQSWYLALCNPATGVSYRCDITLISDIISNMIGTGIVLPDRVYRIGSSMPSGASVGTYMDIDGLLKGYINDPYLDGKVYSVNRRSVELMVKGVEWDNDQPGRQVRLLLSDATGNGDIFSDGEIVTLQFQPQISPIISAPDAIARFTAGVLPVFGNTTLTASSHRKLISIQGAGVITLSSTYPDNVLCAISQNTATNSQSTIKAPAGQQILFNGVSVNEFWLGKNEKAMLVKVDSLWYIVDDNMGYDKVGTIVPGRLPGPNQIIGIGQTILRSDYPRALDYLNKLSAAYPGSVLNAASWSSARTYWGWGNGTTTLQVPDLRGYIPRWLDLGANVDEDRNSSGLGNKPGSAQAGQVGEASFNILIPRGDSYNGNPYNSMRAGRGQDSNPRSPLDIPVTINAGKENRMINAGELPLIYV